MSSPSSLVDRLPALIEAAASVVEAGDLEQVLRRLVSEARAATGAPYAALGVIGEHGVLVEFLHEGLGEDEVRAIGSLPTGRGVLGTVVRERRTIRLASIADHPDSYGFPAHHPPMTSFLGVPVSVGDKAFGNLYLADKQGGFTDSDVTVVEALARIAGSAVSTARLQNRLRNIAVLEDRERIARDLHDSVIQDLFAVGLSLQGIAERVADTTSGAVLDQAVDRLDEAVEALRNYVFRLRSSVARLGFRERLADLVRRMGSAYPSEVTVALDDEPEDEALQEEVLQVVTEALSNALRHAAARKVEVRVAVADGWCSVTVEDDGTGFDPEAPRGGMGLSNMRARAARWGGRAEVVTGPGEGTRVEVTLPVS